ncbi:MAG: DHHA1 domain-containing protein [Candidatus Nanohaloarchaea archaeon]
MVDDILEEAQPAAEKLRDHDGKIRLVGQYDADGISATAIAHEMLDRLGREFEYEILRQLYEEDVERIAGEDEDLIIFVDIGSGQSKLLEEHIIEETGKDVIVSDHHEPGRGDDAEPGDPPRFIHLNPHFLGHDGGEAISAAGMTYLLAKKVDPDNRDLVKYALVGATGDVQKQDGEFLGLNEQLAEEALEQGLVEKRKGLDLYGRTTKPLQKSLMYTSDPHLEGVTNDESGAIQLVKSAGIDIRNRDGFRTLADLSEKEEKQLIQAMIKRGFPVQELLNDIYTLENGYEIDEFSTIINACGRLGEAKKGVRILLEDDQELAERISTRYGRKISEALSYVEENRDNEEVVSESEIGLIDGHDQIEDDFIGTVTTITMSNGHFSSPVVLGVADSDRDLVKFSGRASKDVVEEGFNLGEIISELCEKYDGEGGGHNIAAGAKVPEDHKKEFIQDLDSYVGEERWKEDE